jgi:hypothetical protein
MVHPRDAGGWPRRFREKDEHPLAVFAFVCGYIWGRSIGTRQICVGNYGKCWGQVTEV